MCGSCHFGRSSNFVIGIKCWNIYLLFCFFFAGSHKKSFDIQHKFQHSKCLNDMIHTLIRYWVPLWMKDGLFFKRHLVVKFKGQSLASAECFGLHCCLMLSAFRRRIWSFSTWIVLGLAEHAIVKHAISSHFGHYQVSTLYENKLCYYRWHA